MTFTFTKIKIQFKIGSKNNLKDHKLSVKIYIPKVQLLSKQYLIEKNPMTGQVGYVSAAQTNQPI